MDQFLNLKKCLALNKWLFNKYFLDYYDKDNIKLYVSSGIGTKKYNMRLFNKPSFNFYRLKS